MKTSIRQFLVSLAGASVLGLLSGTAAAVPVVYDVSVNTSVYTGTAGYLDFQFNPAVATAPQATVTITNFSPFAIAQGAPVLDGGAAGSLGSTATITNSAAFNAFFQDVIFGAGFSFRIAFDGTFRTAPSPDGTLFSLNLLDSSFNPLGLGNPLGASLLSVNLSEGNVFVGTNAAPVGNNAGVVVRGVTTHVPAPALLWLLAVGFVVLRRLR